MSGFNVTKISLFVLLSIMLLAGSAWAVTLLGDLDSSGQVNIDDLEILAGQWLGAPGCVGHPDDCADLIGDDGVNLADFVIMSQNWLQRIDPSAPILSFPIGGINVNGTSLDFSWISSVGADNYHLQIASESDFENVIYDGEVGDKTNKNAVSFPDVGRRYYWRIQAGYFAGEAPEDPISRDLLLAESNKWHYRKGTSEPPSDWREMDFTEDGTWLTGRTSIGFGDGDDNTVLSDMQGNYTTLYLRHSFQLETPDGFALDALKLRIYVDDGCIVSINNQEVKRLRVSSGDKSFGNTGNWKGNASWEDFEVTNPSDVLQEGTNIVAIHAFNTSLDSSDVSIDCELIAGFVTSRWSEYSDTGYFVNGPSSATELTIAGVYLVQTHVLAPDDPLFKLVGNRDALLKVQVIAPEGTPAPPVTAVVSVGNDSTTLTLDGPDTLQDIFKAVKGLVDHKYDDSFTAVIPAQWIRPGLSITVKVGNLTVDHDIKVGAPSEIKMQMFDVHYFGLPGGDYPAGTFEELEAKWPVSDLSIERIRNINFPELVVPARSGLPMVRVTSKNDYKVQTGKNFDGEQATALKWVDALAKSGGNNDVAMRYINIIGVGAGGQAWGFYGVGGVSEGILNHELGHSLTLPHWGDNKSYPYKGDMYGIEAPGNSEQAHVGPTWAFDLPTLTFIPPTVQENSVGGEVGKYKKSPMQGGGKGDQEDTFLMRHFSDYGVNHMQNYIEGKLAVLRNGNYYKWNQTAGDYTKPVTSNGVNYPIEQDVQVISVMASMTLADMNVNMVYPPIGPYEGNLIRTFDPTSASDRADSIGIFAPSSGCDFTLRIVQGGEQKTYMLPASGTAGSSPLSNDNLKTKAVNLRASDGEVTKVELLLTPNAEKVGLPDNPEVLHTWTK